MAFPTVQITTTNLDSDSDSPAAARVDLLDAVEKFNTIIDEAGSAIGVALLNGSGQISGSQVPLTQTPIGVMTLAPSSNVVNIQDIVRLTSQPKADILAINTATLATGDITVVSDASGGAPSIAFFNGTVWQYISTGTFTTLS
jgi:hypothetical protein